LGVDISAVLPIGAIFMWSGRSIPTGWVLCDGSNSTPDLRQKFIAGADSSSSEYTLKAQGGENNVALKASEMPSHNHEIVDPGHSHLNSYHLGQTSTDMDDSSLAVWAPTTTLTGTQANTTGISIQDSGEGVSHENRPAYVALYYIMKT
ncbi:MAG: tail fiber protein, partial [Algicola sp.]|nr:tail fiber protein [Algicola sp.]